MAPRTADLSRLPFYDGDVEAAGDPPAVRDLKAAIRAADLLLIATPEYNGTIPGLLGNALDWVSRPYGASVPRGKLVGIISASPGRGGGARARVALRGVLTAAGARPPAAPELIVPSAGTRFDAAGNLHDPEARAALRAYLAALVSAGRTESPVYASAA